MKITIITGKFGMGHLSAAQTLKKQIDNACPEHQTVLADLYEIAFPKHFETIYKGYSTLMLKGGNMVNAAYKSAVHDEKGLPKSLNNPQNFLLKKISAYLQAEQPDLIITTYSLASRLVSDYKRNNHIATPHITCITDVGIHNVWLNPNTALYLVASNETKIALIKKGVSEKRIAVSGIPVADIFQPKQGHLLREAGGIRELLLMGGGLGMMPEGKAFYRELSLMPGVHTTIICGKNDKLYNRLKGYKLPNISVLGCVDNVAELMAKADLLLSKPGGITTFEAMYSQLPILMFPPQLEQEINNCRFIMKHGIGQMLLGSKNDHIEQINKLLHDDAELAQMRQAALAFYRSFDRNALIRIIKEKAEMSAGEEVS